MVCYGSSSIEYTGYIHVKDFIEYILTNDNVKYMTQILEYGFKYNRYCKNLGFVAYNEFDLEIIKDIYNDKFIKDDNTFDETKINEFIDVFF